MNILLLGSGGREHALAWKIAASPLLTKLWCAPGNAGISREAECVALDVADHAAVIEFCKANAVDLVVVGPETPLAAGIVDDLSAVGIKAFGPSKQAAQLEGSKGFTKDLCSEFDIPTGAYRRFTNANDALAYVRAQGAPIVVKADGLAAGKGVVVAMTLREAEDAIAMMFEGGFGAAGAEVVIEEFLSGREISFFALCDGETAIPLATAQDHKRVFDHDEGPNTGGMGAYSPTPFVTPEVHDQIMSRIILPTVVGMKQRGMPFRGILYAGVMLTAQGPKLFEYNVRFGDPECQVLMLRMMSDIVPAFLASCDGQLKNFDLRWFPDPALTVVMAAKGYPGDYAKGTRIEGLDDAAKIEGVEIFHAGTVAKDGAILANGGRVLNVCAMGKTVLEAQQRAYAAVDRIKWPDGFCRRDIAWQAVELERGG
ncbi:phosphoribosylamine--glycine ligase [Bradyrhizobium sp. KBS0727]|uniref:phosphoribosylamine--glycine ligase n=1 Tax=unclassified Bradyrhizobium TaxID=2631580 RepID=UPI00110F28E3|nr:MULTISPECIES: phosphoribosylamine--glycine ligase [unclassified Bradyrhizobium]QDW36706.1 phosphoribosylamine--glycine ligase [Bradyrhizobium sp. KBS0725]QDW43307.1 phosphoribosylamine--glycine ligase [Bradyrhizobium sp. KBS0727]